MNRKMRLPVELINVLGVLGVRAVGHTTLMMRGAENYNRPFSLVAHNFSYAKELAARSRNPNATPVPMWGLEALRGNPKPIIFDHWAIEFMVKDLIDIIEAQEEIIKKLEKQLDDPAYMVE